ncbi:MAG: FimV/HubP family polar landmark protein [Pseudomonadota bacterium]
MILHEIEFKEQEVTMKRIFYFVILLAFTPTLVNAFGLGKLDLNSALNEPFSARIQLLSPTADELDSLKISLADSEAFARAKIDRPFILSKLRFELRRSVDDGPDYIRVYSSDPIREPFLNFLIEVSWSNGRLFREYTVLLDPPLYDPNATPKEYVSSSDSTSSTPTTTQAATTIDDPDHQVVYGEAYEQFANTNQTISSAPGTTYTPSVSYSGGDYGPTTGSDTLWSIASNMRPDSSVSVNKMMLALLRANPDAFINQNINGLKKGQILRAPNESELNAISNAEALAEAQAQTSAWGDIRDNLATNISERPEVSSVSETGPSTTEEETVVEEESEAELKLVAADDGEATEQVSSTDSGSGEELVLAQETIQALTQENIELKDRVKESDALLEDLKRLLSLKDDELAALQEQMAAAAAEEDMMEEAEEEVTAAEEDMMEEAEEEVAAVEEDMMEEAEEEVAAAEEDMMEEAEEEVAAVEEDMMEEAIEVIEPQPESSGIMDTVNEYIAKAKDAVLGNLMIAAAIAGVIILLLIVIVVLKFRKEPAETVHLDQMTEEAFPDFDSGDLGDVGESVPDSEAVTVLPDADSEAETALPEAEADFDLDEEADEEKTQFMAVDDTPVAAEEEPEEEEDPLQEVNTYLAFEQFDQAEEFVRNVINDDPDNPEYHSKLLEVFYTSGNKKSYEEEAKVLHDIVGGEGEYWNIATAMWQEMSPNRALFEAGEDDDDEDDDDADNTGGFVDVTADDETDDDGGDLDFDIGGAEEAPAEEEVIPEPEEDMLDVTAAVGTDEIQETEDADEMLDISGTSGDDLLDLTGGEESTGEDLLDVTAAVGIDESTVDAESLETTGEEDNVLDISAGGGDDLLDLTGGEESAGEDLLDVTAAANLDLDSEEDLLDVTAATSAGADSDELLDLDAGDDLNIDTENAVETESNEIEFDIPVESNEPEAGESETVEFEIAEESADETTSDEASTDDDNVLDFDMSLDDGSDAQEEAGSSDEAGLEVDLGESEEEPVRLDVEESADDMSLDISLEEETPDGDIELDLSIEEDEPEPAAAPADDAPEVDFDFNLDDDAADEPEAEPEFDLDGTVELPKSAVMPAELDEDDDDDDDEDHTVFVPRAAQPEEQTAEDEIATKLDLAKAYVELGDKDSAKNILDEVMAEGNDEQRKQAEDLLSQV